MVISGKQERAVDHSIIVDVKIDGGDVGSAIVGCEDVTRKLIEQNSGHRRA